MTTKRVRHVKQLESGSAGFGRVACDGILTDLLSLLEMENKRAFAVATGLEDGRGQ